MMRACSLLRPDITSIESGFGNTRRLLPSLLYRNQCPFSSIMCFSFISLRSTNLGLTLITQRVAQRFCSINRGGLALKSTGAFEENANDGLSLETLSDSSCDTVKELLSDPENVEQLMKMERKPAVIAAEQGTGLTRWFPYLDIFKAGDVCLNSSEVLEVLDPFISERRKQKFRNVVKNRSYSVCLVVEGSSDYSNMAAAFRSADALGLQSVHVISCSSSKRYKESRRISKGSEKWLDIEVWDSTQECFKNLKSRGYRIATAHLGSDPISIYDMDWTSPTAIVVGNERRGISDKALELSDLHCSIPMRGMVDSFNISVAASIIIHHAACDRSFRLGCHGDLTEEEQRVLLAEFCLRNSENTMNMAIECAARKMLNLVPKL